MGRHGRDKPVQDEEIEDFKLRHLAPVAAAVFFTLYATLGHPGALHHAAPRVGTAEVTEPADGEGTK
ncbi:hypothetical protein SCATT_17140 [Streptantibioticus cattleyicolor NRRL 8057 = DSM 46488]|uniref:Uncharacterized protein n=1 Tax=Streptantibioticus cattleyicolor (strain ATCC 35852 / DSM 46488 / JCM 4925 / NBRC 14057 / NRRL 8057) TaxID=1003195 RepID=F8JR02_STREN|nr:hypothetical protein SCATT_17140 [Streptantibioticus cattleyicolor NRRL 8057 = DSM 46488]MYS58756.1 hypothetical protein [Streptomyces sp. SID5468]CCB74440.1 protein of unknown function [Streptantibioticus cattleyicolor NRRL 8057 = DSM 46488]